MPWRNSPDYAYRAGPHPLPSRARASYGLRDLLGGDPRYQALLEGAGITW